MFQPNIHIYRNMNGIKAAKVRVALCAVTVMLFADELRFLMG